MVLFSGVKSFRGFIGYAGGFLCFEVIGKKQNKKDAKKPISMSGYLFCAGEQRMVNLASTLGPTELRNTPICASQQTPITISLEGEAKKEGENLAS